MKKPRYSRFQAELQASLLVFLYNEERGQISPDELRLRCPSLIHEQVTDADLQICLTALSKNGEIDVSFVRAGDDLEEFIYIHQLSKKNPEEFVEYMREVEEDAIRQDKKLINLETVVGINISDVAAASIERRKTIKGDLVRFFAKMDDEMVSDYFENVLSEFDPLEPAKYTDNKRLVDLHQRPELHRSLVDKLEELAHLVESNNQIMSRKSAELETALTELKVGTAIAKEGRFTIGKIEGALFACLSFFAAKFADAPIGEAAQLCWGLVKTAIQHIG